MYPTNAPAVSARPYYVGTQPVVYTLICFVQYSKVFFHDVKETHVLVKVSLLLLELQSSVGRLYLALVPHIPASCITRGGDSPNVPILYACVQ